jgi:hypothetical protein
MEVIRIFFYGLFMDSSLLTSKGLHPVVLGRAILYGYRIHIGEKAYLLESSTDRVWGFVMELPEEEVITLYNEPGVSGYKPELVRVMMDGSTDSIVVHCYNLPSRLASGSNPEYAAKLLKLAESMNFDSDYLRTIASFQNVD